MNTVKKQLHTIIFGVDTKAGRTFDIVLLFLILGSITILMLESVKEINEKWALTFYQLDWIITGLFTIEYALRIWTSENRNRYIFSFFGLIDLFSILPMFAGLIITGSHTLAVIRVLRLLRLFRVFKLVQFMGEASKLKEALRTSSRKIIIFIYFVIIVSVFVGTLMYVIEGPANGFTSIPRSIYWAIVTLTTVGYGEITPHTMLGQLLALILMVTGYGVIAVPTGLVTAEIVRANTKADKPGRECLTCGSIDNAATAKFCSNCGSSYSSADA